MIDPQQSRGHRLLSYLTMAQHELGQAMNEETIGSEFARLAAAQGAWSAKTPGGPAAPLEQLTAKLEIMANDLYNAGDYAECLLLVLDAANRAGFGLGLLTQKGFEHLASLQAVPEEETPAMAQAS